MYKISLLENEITIMSKEVLEYEDVLKEVDKLVSLLSKNKKIIVYNNKNNKWVKFGEWKIQ